MSHVVVVLGAGATLAEAQSHSRRRKRQPPLDTNFFTKVREVVPEAVARLSQEAVRAGLDDPFLSPEPRMEEFFADAYYGVEEAGGAPSAPAMRLYRELLTIYTRTLTETTGWFYNRSRGAMHGFFKALIADTEMARLPLITFNHDLAAENVLVQLPYRKRWCVDQGYGPLTMNPLGSNLRIPRLPRHDDDCDHRVPIELLKLHGSLNWQIATRSHQPQYHDLFPRNPATVDCILDRVPNVTLVRRRVNRSWRLWPQIVPPIYGKQALISGRYSGLWTRAAESIRDADRLIFVGYSLPVVDVHTERMIASCMRANEGLSHVDVVNPDAAMAHRFASITGASSLSWFSSLREIASN
jgi:hypothetical protein